jgi:hypothetical protein
MENCELEAAAPEAGVGALVGLLVGLRVGDLVGAGVDERMEHVIDKSVYFIAAYACTMTNRVVPPAGANPVVQASLELAL